MKRVQSSDNSEQQNNRERLHSCERVAQHGIRAPWVQRAKMCPQDEDLEKDRDVNIEGFSILAHVLNKIMTAVV